MKEEKAKPFFPAGLSALHLRQQTKDLATVSQEQGMYIFSDCKPVAEYTYLGDVKPAGAGWRALGVSGSQYDQIKRGLIDNARKKYPDADGLILHMTSGAVDKADVIRFK